MIPLMKAAIRLNLSGSAKMMRWNFQSITIKR